MADMLNKSIEIKLMITIDKLS